MLIIEGGQVEYEDCRDGLTVISSLDWSSMAERKLGAGNIFRWIDENFAFLRKAFNLLHFSSFPFCLIQPMLKLPCGKESVVGLR